MTADLFARAGSLADVYGAVDWERHPFGSPQGWPAELRSAVRLCLGSRFPILLWWGSDLVMLYNEAYREMIGDKHPAALGSAGREVWPEIWHEIGPMLHGVLDGRRATFDEDHLLLLRRRGFIEECYFTFSYSPVESADGSVLGVFTAVTETTRRVLTERRLMALTRLGNLLAGPGGEDPCGCAVEVLQTLPDVVAAQVTAEQPEGDGARVLDERSLLLPLPAVHDAPPAAIVVQVSARVMVDSDLLEFLSVFAGQVAAARAARAELGAQREQARALAELDRAKSTFFANVSHELRTPLTLLMAPLRELHDGGTDLPPERREHLLALAVRNGSRLRRLVDDILDLTRFDAGRLASDARPVVLDRLTTDLASLFADAFAAAGLALTVDVEPLPEPVLVDPLMYEGILLNLVSNALKHTFEGGVTVTLRRRAEDGLDGRVVELVVRDTGVGIGEQDRERVFDRFVRLDGVRSRTAEGSGIGLAMVREYAAVHGGSVHLDSTPGVGTAVTVELPLQVASDVTVSDGVVVPSSRRSLVGEARAWIAVPAAPTAPQPVLPSVTSSASGPDGDEVSAYRVLVVDDNADMRDYIAGLVRPFARVVAVPDATTALDVLRRDPVDLVVTDVMMPGIDGWSLIAAVRAEPSTAALPILVITARAGEEASAEGFEAGADAYLTKPFTPRELTSRMVGLLRVAAHRRLLQQQRDRAELLSEVSRVAASSTRDRDLLRDIARLVSDRTGDSCGIYSLQGDRVRRDVLERPAAARGRVVGPGVWSLRDEGMLLRVARSGRPELVPDVTGLPDAEREPYEQGRIGSALAVPLLADGAAIGVVTLTRDQDRPALTGEDVDLAQEIAVRVAVPVTNIRHAQRERRVAEVLQRGLLPTLPQVEELTVAARYLPSSDGSAVGGDWYDVIDLGAGRVGFVIGDVMGHGVQAAAVMGQLRAAVRAYAQLELRSSDVLTLLDRLVAQLDDANIVTCLYGVYDIASRTLTISNAGHFVPYLAVEGRPARPLPVPASPPLGMELPDHRQTSIELPPGAVLAFFTDGLVESREEDLDEGLDALAELLRPEPDLEALADEITARMAERNPHDDDTALLLVRTGAADGELDAVTGQPLRMEVTDAASVSAARRAVAGHAEGWGLPAALLDALRLVVSELVSNAVRYGSPPVVLTLRRSARRAFVEVSDTASYQPHRRVASPSDEGGRGLELVEVLCRRWGVRPQPSGKSVWAELWLDEPGEDATGSQRSTTGMVM